MITPPPPRPCPPPAQPAAAVIDGINVEAVSAAAAGCAGVSALDSGRFGEVASYLPGRQVPGVVVREESVLVQVRSRWGVPAADLLGQIIAAVTPITGHRRVELVIGDIDDPPVPDHLPPLAAVAVSGAMLPAAVPGPRPEGLVQAVTRDCDAPPTLFTSGCEYR
jgi:hypothetical protein